jgi:hypothetical protein
MTDVFVAEVETVSIARRGAPVERAGFSMGPSIGSMASMPSNSLSLQDRARAFLDDAARRLTDQPVATVGLAMAIGFLIGRVARR